MGIYVTLRQRPFFNLRSHVIGRMAFASEAIRNIEGYFFPREITIWRNAPFEEMDGSTLLQEIILAQPATYTDIARHAESFIQGSPLDEVVSSVILIRGKWKFDSEELVGYVSINNNFTWRRTYGDIEVEAYPKGDYSDLVDLLWKEKELRVVLVERFIRAMSALEVPSMELSSIFYSIGVPSPSQDISSIRAAYYARRRDLVADMLSSYIASLRERQDKEILPHMKPFDSNFIITRLFQNRSFLQDLRDIFESSKIIEIAAGSVAFIGDQPDSFEKAYKEIARKVFEQIAKNLPRDEEIAERMAKALRPKDQAELD